MLSERVSDGDERARLMKLRSEGDRKKMRFFFTVNGTVYVITPF